MADAGGMIGVAVGGTMIVEVEGTGEVEGGTEAEDVTIIVPDAMTTVPVEAGGTVVTGTMMITPVVVGGTVMTVAVVLVAAAVALVTVGAAAGEYMIRMSFIFYAFIHCSSKTIYNIPH